MSAAARAIRVLQTANCIQGDPGPGAISGYRHGLAVAMQAVQEAERAQAAREQA